LTGVNINSRNVEENMLFKDKADWVMFTIRSEKWNFQTIFRYPDIQPCNQLEFPKLFLDIYIYKHDV